MMLLEVVIGGAAVDAVMGRNAIVEFAEFPRFPTAGATVYTIGIADLDNVPRFEAIEFGVVIIVVAGATVIVHITRVMIVAVAVGWPRGWFDGAACKGDCGDDDLE